MNAVAAVASHLNVVESAVVRVEEWANCLFAVVKGLGARFVSKKVIKVEETKKVLCMWTLEARMRRQEGKKWVAKVVGLNPGNRSGLDFQFIEPKSIEWGKHGMRKAEFEICEPGYYYDSDGDYFKADADGNAETCSAMEVKTSFGA